MLLEFNANNSYCIAFGNLTNHLPCLCLGTDTLEWWCTSVKYLGVNFVSGKHLKFDFDYVRRKFYSACNCIFTVRRSALHGLCDSNSVRPSVRPSVCLSVTLVDCVHTVRPTIMISSTYGSPIILVSGDIKFIPKFEGDHPERGR